MFKRTMIMFLYGPSEFAAEEALNRNKRQVSPKAMARLSAAQNAMDFTSRVIERAGNQAPDLRKSRMNSYYRMALVRDNRFWDIDPEVVELINKEPESFHAAKTLIARGGNCGEHANLTFQYLRARYPGETIHLASHSMDHGFSLVGELDDIESSEMAVSDAWPTRGKAVLWEDFFAYDARPFDDVSIHETMVADGKAPTDLIAAGIRLNKQGQEILTKKHGFFKTLKMIKQGREDKWVWNQRDTYRDDKVRYVSNEED